MESQSLRLYGILIFIVLLALTWTIYHCFFCKPKIQPVSAPMPVIKEPELKKIEAPAGTPVASPLQSLAEVSQPPPGYQPSCPSYVADGIYLVQSCDFSPYNHMSDRQWASVQVEAETSPSFTYSPTTSVPMWTTQASVNQSPLYDSLTDGNAGLPITPEYQGHLPSEYYHGYNGYTLTDDSSPSLITPVEDLYANFWA